MRTFLREKYFTSNSLVRDNNFFQLKVQNIISSKGRCLYNIVPNVSFLRVKIYLDSFLYNKNNYKKVLIDI